jgi:cysteine desulfurase
MVTADAFDGERPLHPAGAKVLLAAFEQGWASPNGGSQASAQARHLLAAAREEIAAGLGVSTDEVEFWGEPALISPIAIMGAPNFSVGKFVVGATERQEILAVGAKARAMATIPVSVDGILNRDQLLEEIESNSIVAIQSANGETGVRQDISDLSGLVGALNAHLHLDFTASGPLIKLPSYWSTADFPAKSWSGPAGLGIMLINREHRWANPLAAATSASTKRAPGSFSLPLVLAAAASLTGWLQDTSKESARIRALITLMRTVIKQTITDVDLAGSGAANESLPHILSASILNISGEELVNALSREGFAVASGSACVASAIEPSHVLKAMGLLTHGNMRISLMHGVQESEVKRFLALLPGIVERLRLDAGA